MPGIYLADACHAAVFQPQATSKCLSSDRHSPVVYLSFACRLLVGFCRLRKLQKIQNSRIPKGQKFQNSISIVLYIQLIISEKIVFASGFGPCLPVIRQVNTWSSAVMTAKHQVNAWSRAVPSFGNRKGCTCYLGARVICDK